MERNLLIDLVTRAQNGESNAMNELFSAFYNDVYYFALKTVKESDTACDITQETFMEIIRTIGALKEPAAFVTWMKQITYHQCTRYFKKKKDVLVEEDEDGNTVFDTLADESEGSIPSEIIEKEEFRNTILGIINELTEEQRSAVMMYYFDEMTVGKIAEIQGVSEGTVKSRLNYARKALKKSVESYEKKHNIKLHSFSYAPLFLLFFGKECMSAAKAAEIGSAVSAAAVAAGSIGTGTASVAAAAAKAGNAAAATGFAGKIAAVPLVAKIVAGVLAAAVLAGGGAALIGHTNGNTNGVHKYTDKNGDRFCDVCIEYPCGATHNGEHIDDDMDGFCEGCGFGGDVQEEIHYDADNDYICDHCGGVLCLLVSSEVLHRDMDENCICDDCGKEVHGYEDYCGRCGMCGIIEGIFDPDGNGYCVYCGQRPGEALHPHKDENGDEICEICGNKIISPTAPAAATIALESNREAVGVKIEAVEGAMQYNIYLNGEHIATTDTTEYKISKNQLSVGKSEVYVCAVNEYGISENSNTVITGVLAVPEFKIDHDDGKNFLSFPWGDVENADGYVILDEKDNLLATIPVGGTYDFNKVFTQAGTYLCPIYAYADGFVHSEWGYVWVFIGETSGGGYGCATEHYAPTVSINGTVLTIVHNSMEYFDNNYIKATSEYYDVFVNGTRVGGVDIQLQGNTMTFDLAGKAVSGDVITVKTNCQFEADNESLAAVITMN